MAVYDISYLPIHNHLDPNLARMRPNVMCNPERGGGGQLVDS